MVSRPAREQQVGGKREIGTLVLLTVVLLAVKEHEAASFTLHVASDPIDEWLTYRLIEPGYEVWHKVEIRERNLTNWRERVIADHRHTNNACMNCHIHGRDGQSLFYLRGRLRHLSHLAPRM